MLEFESFSTFLAFLIAMCIIICIIFIGSTAVSRSSTFGRGTGSIHMDDVRCNGNENRLIDCEHDSSHNCRHSEDAGVRCLPRSKCPHSLH